VSERGRWLLDQFIAHGLLTSDQYTEAASALREAWTGELHFPQARAAASNTPKTAKSNKRSQLAKQ
jgi:hypothetical protein